MADGYNKAFTHARLWAMDDLRRTGNLSAATRLVGLEIFSCANRINGAAWPSEKTIASRLGLSVRTVRTAINQLQPSYIEVMRRGRNNVYYPSFRMFVDQMGEKISGVEEAATPEKFSTDTGKKQQATPAKNDPLNLKVNPGRSPSTEAATEERKIAQRNKRKARQKAENEIADVVGRECLAEAPVDEVEDLCRRWPDVNAAELFEFKQKYGPRTRVAGAA